MDRIEDLLARLAAARASLPDPGDVPAPNERERISERIALFERFRTSITTRRRRVEDLEETVGAFKAELNRWAAVEARMRAELVAARDRLAALPPSAHYEERQRAEGAVVALERQLGWAKVGPPQEGRLTVSADPFDSAFLGAFGARPHLSAALPPPEIRERLAVEEPELLEARVALDRELASLDQVLRELEAVAA